MTDRIRHDLEHHQLPDPDLLDLMEKHVDPAIRRVVRAKLHATLLVEDEHAENEDAKDLVSEVRAVTLRAMARNTGTHNIENVVSYASRIATNVCNQYFREKYPRFFRLKNGVRYILTHDTRFALWKTADGVWICGLKEWAGRAGTPGTVDLVSMLRANVEPAAISPESFKLLDVVAKAVELLDGPILYGVIVKAIYEILEIDESTEDFSDERPIRSHRDKIPERVEQKQLLETLWKGICDLPLRHRTSLLLNLRNERSESVIELFPLMRIASIKQIAEVLEIQAERFAEMWNDLPWDDNRISEHLGITRQQVINLRQSARAKLRRRLAGY